MNLKEITLEHFRNYTKKSVTLSSHSTLLLGPNGAGKTNLIEGISLLSTGTSFRAQKDQEMIQYGQSLARVAGEVSWEDGRATLETLVTAGELGGRGYPRKLFRLNGVGKRRGDFMGILRTVLFLPEHLELLLGSPSKRREYLDRTLEQVDREYRRNLLSYQKGLRQRNKLLERIREGEAERKQLLFWDTLLIKNGEAIAAKREKLVEFINSAFGRDRISQVFAGLSMEYDRSAISQGRLEQYSKEEIAVGVTLVGPHRDDFIITKIPNSKFQIPNKLRNLAVYGSRGEQRLAVLALKLAELSFVTRETGDSIGRPVLLLDDIFSELDHEHRDRVLQVVGQQQTIISTADPHTVEAKYRKQMETVEL